MHSFGLTERWLVLAEFPLVVNPLALALSGRPYIENYKWKPELGTRFTLVDRATGEATGGFETDACFAFHHVNAYEEGGEVVVDLCAFDDAGVIEDLYLERLREGKPVAAPQLTRFRLGLADRSVTRERLSDSEIELPRINYGRCNERPYRYVWGNANGDGRLAGADRQDRHDRRSDALLGRARLLPRRAGIRRAPAGRARGRRRVAVGRARRRRRDLIPARARRRRPERAGSRARAAPHSVRLSRAVRARLASLRRTPTAARRGCG